MSTLAYGSEPSSQPQLSFSSSSSTSTPSPRSDVSTGDTPSTPGTTGGGTTKSSHRAQVASPETPTAKICSLQIDLSLPSISIQSKSYDQLNAFFDGVLVSSLESDSNQYLFDLQVQINVSGLVTIEDVLEWFESSACHISYQKVRIKVWAFDHLIVELTRSATHEVAHTELGMIISKLAGMEGGWYRSLAVYRPGYNAPGEGDETPIPDGLILRRDPSKSNDDEITAVFECALSQSKKSLEAKVEKHFAYYRTVQIVLNINIEVKIGSIDFSATVKMWERGGPLGPRKMKGEGSSFTYNLMKPKKLPKFFKLPRTLFASPSSIQYFTSEHYQDADQGHDDDWKSQIKKVLDVPPSATLDFPHANIKRWMQEIRRSLVSTNIALDDQIRKNAKKRAAMELERQETAKVADYNCRTSQYKRDSPAATGSGTPKSARLRGEDAPTQP